jgi:hypothetical protein
MRMTVMGIGAWRLNPSYDVRNPELETAKDASMTGFFVGWVEPAKPIVCLVRMTMMGIGAWRLNPSYEAEFGKTGVVE